jgi:carboxypeptidase Taq
MKDERKMVGRKEEQQLVPRFTCSNEHINELLTCMHELSDLDALSALASWDQSIAMPNDAGEVRGHQLTTLQGILHERWTAPRLGRLLARLEQDTRLDGFTDADRGLVRETHRVYERATRLPRKLAEEFACVEAASFEAWKRAREVNDFGSFAPWLTRSIALKRELADYCGYEETRYDALLNIFEPGLTVRKADALFVPICEACAALIKRIQASNQAVDDSCLYGSFDLKKQDALCDTILRNIGYNFSRGQVCHAPHPFTASFGSPVDVRVAINLREDCIAPALMAVLHEGGHALYEQGFAHTFMRTPLANVVSMGIHESQARLWENCIGRSEPFWQGQFTALRATFPDHFATVDSATFVRALNKVEPGLIRITADEVTYNLHIIIRYELEREMINGSVSVESLPGLWNAKYQEYLGIIPDSDSRGILQDFHWTSGFGYFPTYTLGNLYAAQIYRALYKNFPDLDLHLASGDTSIVLNWLREYMYVFGAIYLPEDLIERVTGETPSPLYFVRYLNEKFGALYNLQ